MYPQKLIVNYYAVYRESMSWPCFLRSSQYKPMIFITEQNNCITFWKNIVQHTEWSGITRTYLYKCVLCVREAENMLSIVFCLQRWSRTKEAKHRCRKNGSNKWTRLFVSHQAGARKHDHLWFFALFVVWALKVYCKSVYIWQNKPIEINEFQFPVSNHPSEYIAL